MAVIAIEMTCGIFRRITSVGTTMKWGRS